jgi:hypothetical protein
MKKIVQTIGSHISDGRHSAKHDATKQPYSKIPKRILAALVMQDSKMRIYVKQAQRVDMQQDLFIALVENLRRNTTTKYIQLT